MKKIIYLFVSLLLFAGFAEAETLTAAQKKSVLNNLNRSTASIKSMQSNFTQTKNLALVKDKMVSTGKMSFTQPNKLRWEYTSPYKYLFICNGAKIYVANNSRKDVINTDSNKLFKEIARIMMSTVTGKALSENTDFSVDLACDAKYWIVTLVPKRKEMKNMFSKIQLSFLRSTNIISEINLFEKTGDKTNIKLMNISINNAVSESLFTIPK